MIRSRRILLVAGVLALATLGAMACWQHARSALWRIVDGQCVPAAQAGRASACVEVSPAQGAEAGFAVLKDRRGAWQYLLIPTRRVSGIEDPALLEPAAAAYLPDAWRARRWMDAANRAPVPREDVALALNSSWSRSQDQLHVHISCVRADLRARLQALDVGLGERWIELPGGWQGHPYIVRRLAGDALADADLLREVGRLHPGDMGRQALAVVGSRHEGRPAFWLLETHVDLASRWLGGIEGDVQDHDCAVLKGAAPASGGMR